MFNPATPLDWLMHVIDKLDLVLIMSVNPGFGGQSFIPHALDKLRAARKLVDSAQQRTGRAIAARSRRRREGRQHRATSREAGADTFVAGSAIFGAPDYRGDDRADARSAGPRRVTQGPSQRGAADGIVDSCRPDALPVAEPAIFPKT